MDHQIQELRSLQRLAPERRLDQGFVRNLNFFMSCSGYLPDGIIGCKCTSDHDVAADFRSSESDLHAAATSLPISNDVMGLAELISRYESELAGSSIDCPIVIDDEDAYDRFLDLATAHFRMLSSVESSASVSASVPESRSHLRMQLSAAESSGSVSTHLLESGSSEYCPIVIDD